jgi:hypothetical protein
MHRSHTSLTALVLAGLGVDLGPELIPGDERNPRGYAEDTAVVALHKRLLVRACAGDVLDPSAMPDWGYTPGAQLNVPEDAIALMTEYSEQRRRRAAEQIWGWKDPRTSLLLTQWSRAIEDVRFVALYRRPEQIQRSFRQMNFPTAVINAAADIWSAYNRAILDFHGSHPERILIVESSITTNAPQRLVDLIFERLHVALSGSAVAAAARVLIAERVTAPVEPHGALSPSKQKVWDELQAAASWLPPAGPS